MYSGMSSMMFAITVSFFLTLRRIIYNTMKTKYRAMILTVCFCVGVLLSVGCEPDCTCDCEKNGFDTPPPFVPDPSLPLPDPDPEPGPAPEPAEARRQTIEYFLTQLDQDDIVLIELGEEILYCLTASLGGFRSGTRFRIGVGKRQRRVWHERRRCVESIFFTVAGAIRLTSDRQEYTDTETDRQNHRTIFRFHGIVNYSP